MGGNYRNGVLHMTFAKPVSLIALSCSTHAHDPATRNGWQPGAGKGEPSVLASENLMVREAVLLAGFRTLFLPADKRSFGGLGCLTDSDDDNFFGLP